MNQTTRGSDVIAYRLTATSKYSAENNKSTKGGEATKKGNG